MIMDVKLLKKLNQPIHITYISQYIFKKDMDETKKIIEKLINENIIEESEYAKNYYVLKNKKNE
jgi:hypothetical protein